MKESTVNVYSEKSLSGNVKKIYKHIVEFEHIPNDKNKRRKYFLNKKSHAEHKNHFTQEQLFDYVSFLINSRESEIEKSFTTALKLENPKLKAKWDTFSKAGSSEKNEDGLKHRRRTTEKTITPILERAAKFLGLKNFAALVKKILVHIRSEGYVIPALQDYESIIRVLLGEEAISGQREENSNVKTPEDPTTAPKKEKSYVTVKSEENLLGPRNETIAPLSNLNPSLEMSESNHSIQFDPFKSRVERLQSEAIYEREGLLSAICEFIHENDRGYITVEGAAGAGKSSVLASAIQHFESKKINCVWHFNNLGDGLNTTLGLIKTLYTRISKAVGYDLSHFKDQYENIQNNTAEYPSFIKELVEYLSQAYLDSDKPLVILVDALDEISDADKTINRDFHPNLQTIPSKLPANVYFLISSRGFDNQNYGEKHLKVDLSDLSENSYQKNDIENYIRLRMEEASIQQWIKMQDWEDVDDNQEAFFEHMCQKSEYVFIYLFHVFNDIDSFDIGTLPHGLKGYFQSQYNRLNIDQKTSLRKKLILASVQNFKPSCSYDFISAFSDIDLLEIDSFIANWLRVRLVYKEVEDGHAFIRFFHLSFYDFLNDKDEFACQDLEIYRKSTEAYKRLADDLLKITSFTDSGVIYHKSLTDRIKGEYYTEILNVLPKAGYIKETADLLCNPHFGREFQSVLLHGAKYIIIRKFMDIYSILNTGSSEDIAEEKLKIFFNNTKHDDAFVKEEDIYHVMEGQRSDFRDAYTNLKLSKIHERLRSKKEINIFGFTQDDLDSMSKEELLAVIHAVRSEYRDKRPRQLEKAQEAYSALEGYFHRLLSENDPRISRKDICRVEYEAAYIAFMEGRYIEAAKLYEAYIASTTLANDLVGVEAGKNLQIHNLYLSGSIDATEARKRTFEVLENLDVLYKNTHSESARSWIFNSQNRLFEYSVFLGDLSDAEIRYEHMITNEYVSGEVADEDSKYLSTRMKTKFSTEARFRYLEKKYEEALKCLAIFLDIDLSPYGARDNRVKTELINTISLSRDYLYAGMSLAALNDNVLAEAAFQSGLDLDPNEGNHFYQDLIRQEMQALL